MRWRCAFTLGLLCAAGLSVRSPVRAADRAELFDLFSQAKQLFRQANELVASDPERARELYRKAAMRFERIANEGGIHNGRLYYNIGNAYFRMGDIGRAILFYRRAQRLIPDDPNLRQNLAYARTKCVDKIGQRPRTQVLRTLFFWHYDLASRTRLIVFAVFFAVVWACAAVRLFAKRPLAGWVLIAAAGVALLMFASLLAEAVAGSRYGGGVVLASEVTARKGPAGTYQPSFKEPLHAGTEFELLEDRAGWYHIELSDGRRCWLPPGSAGLVQ